MAEIEKRIKELGITLPDSPPPMANYVPAVQTGNLLFVAGLGPAARDDGTTPNGKVGKDLSLDEGYEAARLVGINLLSRLKSVLGDLDRVERVVKLLSMVNCTPEFNQQPQVANGCSDLLVEVFGDKGRHARSAVGMASLPNDIPVEIEMIVEIRD
ncbi:MAG: RidA family protein [Chloroflexota bacterium]|nr:RidA family protein [Chloroflexota bacterium]MYC07615.1 RidA family protein [Chloroflexota bacterium]